MTGEKGWGQFVVGAQKTGDEQESEEASAPEDPRYPDFGISGSPADEDTAEGVAASLRREVMRVAKIAADKFTQESQEKEQSLTQDVKSLRAKAELQQQQLQDAKAEVEAMQAEKKRDEEEDKTRKEEQERQDRIAEEKEAEKGRQEMEKEETQREKKRKEEQ